MDREGAFLHPGARVLEDGKKARAVQVPGSLQACCGREGGKEVDQFDQGAAAAGVEARHRDDQGHPGHFLMEVALLPEGVLPEVVAVVAGEDNGGLLAQAEAVELTEDAPDLLVHEGYRGVIGGPHPLLVVGKFSNPIQFRAAAGDGESGHIFQVVGDGPGKGHLLPRVGVEVLLRLDHRVVGTNQPGGEQEALFLVLPEKLDGLAGGLVVRLVGAVTLVTHGNEHPVGHAGGLAPLQLLGEDVQVQACVVARGVGLLSGGVELLGPRRRDIESICPGDDVPGNPHVVDLAHPGAVEAVGLEVLAQVDPPLGPMVTAVHEGGPGRGTGQSLAVGPVEDHRAGRQLVDIGGLADLVPVAPKYAGLEIIRDDKEDILNLGSGVNGNREQEQKEKPEGGHDHDEEGRLRNVARELAPESKSEKPQKRREVSWGNPGRGWSWER